MIFLARCSSASSAYPMSSLVVFLSPFSCSLSRAARLETPLFGPLRKRSSVLPEEAEEGRFRVAFEDSAVRRASSVERAMEEAEERPLVMIDFGRGRP